MAFIRAVLDRHRRNEQGQGFTEYALILTLIAIVAIIALVFLGRPHQPGPQRRRQLGLSTATRYDGRPGPTSPDGRVMSRPASGTAASAS